MIKDMERAVDIFRRRELGETYLDIGVAHGISLERTRQIYRTLQRMQKHPMRQGFSQDEFLDDLLRRASASEENARIEIKMRNVENKKKALIKAVTRRDAMRRALELAERAHLKAEAEFQAAQDDLAQEGK